MADFCQQCSISTFGKDYRELAGMGTKESDEAGKYPVVICEGCGPVQVDSEGKCISEDCSEEHGKPTSA